MLNKIKILTLGCAKNTVDSEKIAANLKALRLPVQFCNYPQEAHTLIINTCGFILDAKQESINTILEAVELKKKHLIKNIFVTGCLSTRYLEELKKEIPEVDEYFTVHNFPSIIKKIKKNTTYDYNYHARLISTPPHYAYLKIAEGCNRKCSFCAIPSIRGKYQSETIEHLVYEATTLAQAGVKELILIAQDLTYYGKDIYKKASLASLINKLSEIEGIEWIRLHYIYPQFFTQDLIETIAQNPKVCKYIDIPIQHISNNVLKLMKRNTDASKLKQLLYKLRKQIPNVHLRTTLLVGHPGETKRDFDELIDFITEFKFEKLGAFAYSHEEGTYADKHYKDSISNKIKQQRLSKVMQVQQEISSSINRSFIGTYQQVLIDRKENGYAIGRTQYDSPEIDNEVLLKDSHKYHIGQFYNVRIIDSFEFDLVGE
ncbi:MAG: 30S ribosomal protein S12 methylthiotransferase RimO [Bacteroidales bacterium]